MFAGMLIHGGIVAFIILVVVCMMFGDDKTKKEATKAAGDVAGCGCLLIVGALILVAFIASNYR